MRITKKEVMPINAFFDETGLELEKIVENLLIKKLQSNEELQNCYN